MHSGTFITFEGGEGSGKSTQIALLEKAFQNAGIECVKTREPGGSAGAEQIRDLLVNGDVDAWDADTETLLFYAARLDHVNKIIKPALKKKHTVLCDRFADSTMVYQGVGKQVPNDYIHALHKLTLVDFSPNLTLMFDIDPKIGLKRAADRNGGEGRFESMDISFHQQVRQGFLKIAKTDPERCAVIDASLDIQTVHQSIITLVNKRLGTTLKSCQT